jgi:hypothetical protein
VKKIKNDIYRTFKPKNMFDLGSVDPLNANNYEDQLIYTEHLSHLKFKEDMSLTLYNIGLKESSDARIEYLINKDGFRSKSFDSFDKNKTNILFAGCSWTFGEALPEEHIWPRILSDKIGNALDQDVEFYNLGVMGGSIELSIKNLLGFIKRYGKPDYIFAVMPNYARSIAYNEKTNKFMNVVISSDAAQDQLSLKEYRDTFIRYTMGFSEKEKMLHSSILLSTFEEFCESSGIKFLWSTYAPKITDQGDKESNNEYTFKNFVHDPHVWKEILYNNEEGYQRVSDTRIYPNKNNIMYWDLAADERHPGVAWQEDISNTFFNELKKRGLLP